MTAADYMLLYDPYSKIKCGRHFPYIDTDRLSLCQSVIHIPDVKGSEKSCLIHEDLCRPS